MQSSFGDLNTSRETALEPDTDFDAEGDRTPESVKPIDAVPMRLPNWGLWTPMGPRQTLPRQAEHLWSEHKSKIDSWKRSVLQEQAQIVPDGQTRVGVYPGMTSSTSTEPYQPDPNRPCIEFDPSNQEIVSSKPNSVLPGTTLDLKSEVSPERPLPHLSTQADVSAKLPQAVSSSETSERWVEFHANVTGDRVLQTDQSNAITQNPDLEGIPKTSERWVEFPN